MSDDAGQTTSGTGSGNLAVFSDLTQSVLNLQLGAIDLGNGTIDRNAISVIQIVNTFVPEPTTASLALLGMGGLMMRRRRMA